MAERKGHLAIENTKSYLQDLVLVVSLVRTLTESFGSAGNLYRKLRKKGNKIKHVVEDTVEQKLASHGVVLDASESESERPKRRLSERKNRDRKRRDSLSESDADRSNSIDYSTAIVKSEYKHGYEHLGDRFAEGDAIAQNQLQAQIIAMQQTIISIYQDCEHEPSSACRARLLRSTRAARTSATEALALLYQRLQPVQHPRMPGAFPELTAGSTELVCRKTHEKKTTAPEQPTRLFCPYARKLQEHPDQRLAESYLEGGDGRCPHCKARIRAKHRRRWEIVLQDRDEEGQEFMIEVGSRFLVKSHRAGGGFACLLCSRCRDHDTVCEEAYELIHHIGNDHSVEEVQDEVGK